MKKFNILLSLCLFVFACTPRVDDVFDEQSAIRVQEEIDRVDEILNSATNGWIMYYYANPNYGGYNLRCVFNGDNTVTVNSEIDPAKQETSHYKFEQSQGVVLSFDEYNSLFHYFSDPKNPDGVGSNGQGMLGDFEFRVLSATQEKVVLKGKKHDSIIEMYAAADDFEWSTYMAEVGAVETAMMSKKYFLTFGEKTVIALKSNRALEFLDEESQSTITIPFIFNEKGVRFYGEFEYAGYKVRDLTYSAEDEGCFNEDKSVSLKVRPTPMTELIQSGEWFISGDAISEKLKPYFNDCVDGSAAEGEKIIYMWIGADYNEAGWGLAFRSGNYFGALFMDSTVVDDNTITLNITSADDNGSYYVQKAGYSALREVFNATFKLSTTDVKNPMDITMVKSEDEEAWLTLSANEVPYPFGE